MGTDTDYGGRVSPGQITFPLVDGLWRPRTVPAFQAGNASSNLVGTANPSIGGAAPSQQGVCGVSGLATFASLPLIRPSPADPVSVRLRFVVDMVVGFHFAKSPIGARRWRRPDSV